MEFSLRSGAGQAEECERNAAGVRDATTEKYREEAREVSKTGLNQRNIENDVCFWLLGAEQWMVLRGVGVFWGVLRLFLWF